jgi:hypothetical protein
VTSSATEIKPRETEYAACLSNNVVNHIRDINGQGLFFDCVIYRPAEGFPIENELVVHTTSATNCCIACQTTANCAGSFFAPSDQECHLTYAAARCCATCAVHIPLRYRLPVRIWSGIPVWSVSVRLRSPQQHSYPPLPHQRPTLRLPLPHAKLLVPLWRSLSHSKWNREWDVSHPVPLRIRPAFGYLPLKPLSLTHGDKCISHRLPLTTATPVQNSNGTCAAGSMSLYLGTIQGQEDFPEEYALVFSNGPCGRFSAWPVPVVDVPVESVLGVGQ